MKLVQIGVIAIRNNKGEYSSPIAIFTEQAITEKIGMTKQQEKALCDVAKLICEKIDQTT